MDALGLTANLDRAVLELTAIPDRDVQVVSANLDRDVRRSDDRSLDRSAACLVQTLDRPGAKALLAARFPVEAGLEALLILGVLANLDQENREVWEDLDRDDQVALAANLDQDDQVDRQNHQMEERCNTRFQL